MISWTIFIIFSVLSYVYSWWFTIGIVAIGLFKYNHWKHYSSRPWRKVHFPMMLSYASALGIQKKHAQIEEREFQPMHALLQFLEMTNPNSNISHEELIEREFQRCLDFDDETFIGTYLMSTGAKLADIEEVLERIRLFLQDANTGVMVRMLIASMIEEEYSSIDRGEYIYEMATGGAN